VKKANLKKKNQTPIQDILDAMYTLAVTKETREYNRKEGERKRLEWVTTQSFVPI
jgi:hypothetical protein